MKHFIFLAIGIVMFNSCKKESIEKVQDDFIVFGHFYGECMGEECVELFKLTNSTLFEDTNDNYPSSLNPYNGNFTIDRSSLINQIDDIWEAIPEQLLDENTITIGEPDAGDWGGIYFQYHHNGADQYWLIDKMKENVPQYLNDFIDSIEAKISLINEN